MMFTRVASRFLPIIVLAGAWDASAETISAEPNKKDYAQLSVNPDRKKHDAAAKESKHASPPKTEEILVTATGLSRAAATTKTRTPIIESPQTISIVNRDEIELRASPTIADALAYTAGVQADPQGPDNRVDGVSVRGFGAGGFSSNNNFIDGLRLPNAGQWTGTSFDPYALQQIEVLKGPSGALYGQTAPGGIVNLVTKKPTKKSEAEFFLQGQGFTKLSNWQGEALADMSGALNKTGTVSGRIVGLVKHGGTQINDVSSSRYYISPSLTWEYAPHSTWTLVAQYQRDQGGSTFQFLPQTGALYSSKGRYIANDANIGEPKWNSFDRNQVLIGSFLEHRFNRYLTIRNNSRYTYLDTFYRSTVLSGDTVTDCSRVGAGCVAGETVQRRAVEVRGKSQGVATDTQVEGHVKTGPVRHLLLVGTDYFYTRWNQSRDLVSGTNLVLPMLDIFNPVARGVSGYGSHLSPNTYSASVSQQNGIYFQDQLKIERLRITIGGRQDWSRDNMVDLLKKQSYNVNGNAFTWRAGAVYLFDNGLAPYFSYAQSFQPQTSDPSMSATGRPFQPSKGDQYEAGLRYQYGKSIYITFGGYQIEQNNMLINYTPPAGTPLCANAAVNKSGSCYLQGKARVRGLELEGRANLPWDMSIIFTGTRSDTTVQQGPSAGQIGNSLSQAPKWMASLFVDQRIRKGIFKGVGIGGGVRYTGKSYGDLDNTLVIPDYTLFDMFLRYDFGLALPAYKGMSFSLNMRNIANKRFVATCTAKAACYYGQGRSLTARLEYRW